MFSNALTDVLITSRKHELKLQTLAKQWRSMKASEFSRKYPKTPDFDHSNYRLFEMIPVVPGTSNNRGLTVLQYPENPSEILVMP